MERLRNCRVLLGCLVTLLVAHPFLEDVARPLIVSMLLAAVFLAGVLVVDAGRRFARRAFIITAIQIALTVISLIQRETDLSYKISVALTLIAMTALILYSTSCVLHYVLEARTITQDQIYAGVCMYLMLGFAFGAVFHLLSILEPRSFIASADLLAGGQRPDLVYFSFVTLATLGYGDITPRTNLARSTVVVEALAGMLYIAIFMARLVSMHSGEPGDEPHE